MLVASAPISFWGKARVQVGKSSAVVMSQVSSKQEETTLLLPSPSLVAKTVVAIYSADQKKMCKSKVLESSKIMKISPVSGEYGSLNFFHPLHESINYVFHHDFYWTKQTSVLYFIFLTVINSFSHYVLIENIN